MQNRLAALISTAFLCACASTRAPIPDIAIPDKLKPAANEALAMVVPAKGVQIYECRAKKDQAGAYEWAFVAPEAALFDTGGKEIGKHYAGPHWEALDGSKVVGTVKERADAPVKGAIPWLLLSTRPTGGNGAFSKVTSIQRIHTAGGAAPQDGCGPSTPGKIVRVDYTADYYMYANR